MANFRGTIRGARGEASRLGHSRLNGRVAGWNIGVNLCAYRGDDGANRIGIHVDGGNAGAGHSLYVGTVVESDGEPTFIPSPVVRSQCRSLDAAQVADNELRKARGQE
jgi:hypothetical protein